MEKDIEWLAKKNDIGNFLFYSPSILYQFLNTNKYIGIHHARNLREKIERIITDHLMGNNIEFKMPKLPELYHLRMIPDYKSILFHFIKLIPSGESKLVQLEELIENELNRIYNDKETLFSTDDYVFKNGDEIKQYITCENISICKSMIYAIYTTPNFGHDKLTENIINLFSLLNIDVYYNIIDHMNRYFTYYRLIQLYEEIYDQKLREYLPIIILSDNSIHTFIHHNICQYMTYSYQDKLDWNWGYVPKNGLILDPKSHKVIEGININMEAYCTKYMLEYDVATY